VSSSELSGRLDQVVAGTNRSMQSFDAELERSVQKVEKVRAVAGGGSPPPLCVCGARAPAVASLARRD
jgi:hypothetical protein